MVDAIFDRKDVNRPLARASLRGTWSQDAVHASRSRCWHRRIVRELTFATPERPSVHARTTGHVTSLGDHRRMNRRTRFSRAPQTPHSPRHATAADAIHYLASICDGAVRRDGHGFASDHVTYGHWLAGLPPDSWTPAEHIAARQLVRIYRNQLTRAGFAPADIVAGRRPRRISRRAASRLRAGWASDPSGLYEWRWWNGLRWTEHVDG